MAPVISPSIGCIGTRIPFLKTSVMASFCSVRSDTAIAFGASRPVA
jgi:hypothetical protein